MTQQEIAGDAPGTALFPQFQGEIYALYLQELEGLTDEQLDFESEQWGWSQWSIRRNVSHVASGDFRWLLERWGARLFPQGLPDIGDWAGIMASPYDRRLDESKYWELDSILAVFRQGLALAWSVLESETVASLQTREIEQRLTGGMPWQEAHPRGVRPDPEQPGQGYITLEATFRHRYYEYIAHLYNIQRLKKAQGLPVAVPLPITGYLATAGWDLSEP